MDTASEDNLVGQRFKHRRTGRQVEIIAQEGKSYLTLRHASGRITQKRRHYFDFDYIPNNKDAQ